MTTIRVIRFLCAVILLAGSIFIGGKRINQLPPMGPFLDPASGIWSVARAAELPSEADGEIEALGQAVSVIYDRRGVPHIRAESIDDAIRALGYVVARHRLFQMELQARAAAGRLTEWLGERVLASDRQQRSIGMSWSADRNIAALDPASKTLRYSILYAEGVNAWIKSMEAKDIPIEYRFLGAVPGVWEPVNSILTFKRMGYTLSYSTHDLWRLDVADVIGRIATDALFPRHSPIQEPIQPNGENAPRFDYEPLPPPPERERYLPNEVVALEHWGTDQLLRLVPLVEGDGMGGDAAAAAAWVGRGGGSIAHARRGQGGAVSFAADASEWYGGELGSNNWAVSPSRSATGNALLAGDPHLSLTLPSVWYEVHIVVPGELDVYGVTIPGIPGVVIGFNRDFAWSFTNTGADVVDYYWETLDHESAPMRYLLDGDWLELDRRFETYLDQAGDVIAEDTLYATHRGPVIFTDRGPMSMRWTVLEDAGSIGTLVAAALSRSVEEFAAAMVSYHAPAQNMIAADRNGNIGIRSTGLFPIRPGNGDGTLIRDGSTSASDWLGYWRLDEYPGSVNPEQGYLASANQEPIDPRLRDKYLGVDWPRPWRAMRINELLRRDSAVTVDDMFGFHTDPGNVKADLFVPAFLRASERKLAEAPNDAVAEAARLLGEWNRRYTMDNERAVLFETALSVLTNRTWDEFASNNSGRRIATPSETMLAVLLQFPESRWWDHNSTDDTIETRDVLLVESLVDALEQVKEQYGLPEDGGWRWDGIRHANVWHLLGFRAFSATNLPIQGGSGTLNPSSGSGTHGASWRMVVELGEEIRAWVTYPGGQSGNPLSRLYQDRIQQWVDGDLDPVFFPNDPGDLPESDILSVLTLESEGR